jgi:subtilase family serine protease
VLNVDAPWRHRADAEMRICIAQRAARAYPAAFFISQRSSEVQVRRLVSVLGVVSILLGAAAAPAVAGVTVGAPGLMRSVVDVCGPAIPGDARCHAKVIVYGTAVQPFASSPSGYNPVDLWSAYKLPTGTALTWSWNRQTVAIVDAYDDPNAEADLGVYRNQFGLPPCTTANTCFTKVNQSGVQGSYPRANGGWAEEISLDLDMVSAICANCKILLVEASSASFTNLGTAVNTAATAGANAISNSYGGSESSSDLTYDNAYFKNHTGIAITVSSGDGGYAVEYPAASQYVTAVGGTTLTRASNTRGWTETAWSGAGSGCSKYDPEPSWQAVAPGPGTAVCAMRNVADVSAVADPNTGVSVYDSYTYRGLSGWLVFGGTSVSSPIIASVYALAGNAGPLGTINYGSYPYSQPSSSLNDVTSGSNGSCGGSYLCTAGPGYDGPTGLGTPNGTGGF